MIHKVKKHNKVFYKLNKSFNNKKNNQLNSKKCNNSKNYNQEKY